MAIDLQLNVDSAPVNLIKIYDVSQNYGLSAYDASYLELAIRLNLKLATRDKELVKAAQQVGLFYF